MELKETNISFNYLIEKLRNLKLKDLRGVQDYEVYLRKSEFNSHGVNNTILEKLKTIKPSDARIILVTEQNISGWQNPYLCI